MITGGRRARFVHDSLIAYVSTEVSGLGWLDPGRVHVPIKILGGPQPDDEPVTQNSLGFRVARASATDMELGSGLSDDTTVMTLEFYAEDDSIGIHFMNDVRDILRGRIGTRPFDTFPIYDFLQATPAVIGFGSISDIALRRTFGQITSEATRHWFTIDCHVHDYYDGRQWDGYPSPTTAPSPDLYPVGE